MNNFSLRRVMHGSVGVLFLLGLFLNATTLHAQDATQILQKVIKKFQAVKDYEADVALQINIDFVKAPNAKGKLYYKQPNKLRLKSDDFAMLPKQGLNMTPLAMLQGNAYRAYPHGNATVNGVNCTVIDVLPDTGDVIRAVLYVDTKNDIILKNETTTKKGGTVTMLLEYGDARQYALPSKMTMTFDVPEFKLPKSVSGDITSEDKPNKKKNTTGSIIMTCWNYKINKGVPDSVFQ